MILELFVRVNSGKYLESWQIIVKDHPNVKINFYKSKEQIVINDHSDYILMLEESVIFDKNYLEIDQLVKELDYYLVNWALASSRGISCNLNEISYDKSENGLFPIKSAYAKPVIAITGSVILINRRKLPDYTIYNILKFSVIDIYIPILELGLIAVVTHKLMIFERSNNYKKITKKIISLLKTKEKPNFRLESKVKGGEILFSFERYYNLALKLFDKALINSFQNHKPSVTIVIRTILERDHLLKRLIDAIAKIIKQDFFAIIINILIITDQPENLLFEKTTELKKQNPELNIITKNISKSSSKASRTNLMVNSFKLVSSDYLWFIDDDDYPSCEAFNIISRNLSNSGKTLLVANANIYYEQYCSDNLLKSSVPIHHYYSKNIYLLFKGKSCIPICACIFPVAPISLQLQNLQLNGDYYEDYSLLILALTSSNLELLLIDEVIANISVRNSGNSITLKDKFPWNYSYINFFSELIASPNSGSIVMWQMAKDLAKSSSWQSTIKQFILFLVNYKTYFNNLVFKIKIYGLKYTLIKLIQRIYSSL